MFDVEKNPFSINVNEDVANFYSRSKNTLSRIPQETYPLEILVLA